MINAGVELDSSFVEQYGDYPLVTDYDRTDENCPWEIRYRETGALFSPQNWWEVPDFMDLQVVGNRDDLSPSVQFSPASWEGYVHPEGVDMFVTKFWHKTTWGAVAQRQYLMIGGLVSDYANGIVTGVSVFRHEMGHCFGLDDIYSPTKYPAGNKLIVSVMGHGGNNPGGQLTAFDALQLRMAWEFQLHGAVFGDDTNRGDGRSRERGNGYDG